MALKLGAGQKKEIETVEVEHRLFGQDQSIGFAFGHGADGSSRRLSIQSRRSSAWMPRRVASNFSNRAIVSKVSSASSAGLGVGCSSGLVAMGR